MTRKQNKKGRSTKGGQFIAIPYLMARSDAWRSLTPRSIKVYLELRTRYHGGNNGQLTLSLQEAATLLEMGKSTVQQAFNELVEKGFIVRVKAGHWYGRKAAEWAVTNERLDGYPATNAWQRWRYPKSDPRYSGGTMRAVATRNRTRGGEKKPASGPYRDPSAGLGRSDGAGSGPHIHSLPQETRE
jgi:hypothetical protein